MKKFIPNTCLLLTVLSLCSLQNSYAQQGTSKYKFTSRADVVPALNRTRGNLHATYEVLMCAVKQGYSRTSLGYYENIVVGHEFNASVKDSAAYSLAFNLCDGPGLWHWKPDNDLKAVKKSKRVNEQYFRERALKMGSGSPEVLVMTSIYGLYQGNMEERGQAYRRLITATKRSPKWADAYFWLGMAACNYGLSYQTRITREEVDANTQKQYRKLIANLGNVAIRAYDHAEKFDIGLKPYLYLERISACNEIGSKKSARMVPIYAAAHLKAFPQFDAWYKKQWGKGADAWLETRLQIAKKTELEAES